MTWLRCNLAALIVIVIVVPALAYVLVGAPLLERSGRSSVITVAQGDPVEAAGHRFTLTASQEFPGTGTGPGTNSIPTGSSLIGALLDVEPVEGPVDEDAPATCDTELTSRAGGTDRAWHAVSSPSDFDYAIGDDRTTVCILDDGEKFELEQVFLVPADTYGGATLDLTVGTTTYRFELAPQ